MKNIVIVGAGFAGINVALGLEKSFKYNKNIKIILVNKHDYHLFSPSLVEVATAEEELVTLTQLKKSVALPIGEILQGREIKFIQGEFTGVDTVSKVVILGNKRITYDYLILATGGEPNFVNVEGAKEFSLPLGSLTDAFRMRNALDFSIQSHSYDLEKQLLRYVIIGGGYKGAELAGEIKNLINFLSWKYSYPPNNLEVLIVHGENELVSGFSKTLSQDVLVRLNDVNVRVQFHRRVVKIDRQFVYFLNGEKLVYELLFWAGGIKATEMPSVFSPNQKTKGRLQTDEFLRVKGFDEIFVVGDLAYIEDRDGKAVPQSAQDAIHQGQYLAKTIPVLLKNVKPKKYYPKKHGFIVRAHGKWAVLKIPPFYFKGYFAYLANIVAHFLHYYSLVGFWKALRYVIREMDYFSRND